LTVSNSGELEVLLQQFSSLHLIGIQVYFQFSTAVALLDRPKFTALCEKSNFRVMNSFLKAGSFGAIRFKVSPAKKGASKQVARSRSGAGHDSPRSFGEAGIVVVCGLLMLSSLIP
jgi:hypothetical protein